MALVILVPGPRNAARAGDTGATAIAIAAPIAGVLGVATIGYFVWTNRPGAPERVKIPGEFYAGIFGGGSLVGPGSRDWSVRLPTGTTNLGDVGYQAGVVGGLKFGYFCDKWPYGGLEVESNFTRHDVRAQNVSASPAIPGIGATASLPAQKLNVWTSALKLMFRYGFFKDQEVPFGRLQPYVGIGPGFVVVYGDVDSAKNFSLEVQAGIRYMALKNVSIFTEYKFSQQWNIELESQRVNGPLGSGLTAGNGTATFDFDTHKFVIGVAYHF
jgi:opacity protein-like surface antigen